MRWNIKITEYRSRITRLRLQTRWRNVFIKKIRKCTDLIRASKRLEEDQRQIARGLYPKLGAPQLT